MADPLAQVAEALYTHRIECTGYEGVTCRSCRDKGWMSWTAFAAHQAHALAAAGLVASEVEWRVHMTDEAREGGGSTPPYTYCEASEDQARRLIARPGFDAIETRSVTPWRAADGGGE